MKELNKIIDFYERSGFVPGAFHVIMGMANVGKSQYLVKEMGDQERKMRYEKVSEKIKNK